jgi:phosphohistidine swiveling domain-containing protein
MSEPWVQPLDQVGRDDHSLAGGKGANLGELIRVGVPVPPGFVVTTMAFTTAAGGPTPTDIERAIVEAYRALGEGRVAVRSSATAEDLPGAAFAGLQDTFLNVSGEPELLDAIRRCWASLGSDRAVAYRERRGIPHEQVTMAVVVQRMVDAEVAGVLFTANPVTGARSETVIDLGLGLGEAVVSGSVTAEHIVVDDHGRRTPAQSANQSARQLLGDAGLDELVATGAGIAAHFGRPQDIEWAYADQTLWIVQARPMTALPPAPLALNRVQCTYVAQLAELLPIRPYPLDMTTWTVRGLGRVLTRMFAVMVAVRVDVEQMLPEVDGVVDQLLPPRIRPSARTLTTPIRMRPRVARFQAENWTADPRFADFEREVADLRAVDVTALSWRDLLDRPERAFATLDRFIDLRIDYLPGVAASLVRLRLLLALAGRRRAYGELVRGFRTRTGDANRALADLADLVRQRADWREVFAREPLDGLAERVAQDRDFSEIRDILRRYTDEFGQREATTAFLVSQPTWGEDPRLPLGAIKGLVNHSVGAADLDSPGRSADLIQGRRVRTLRLGPRIAAAAASARAGIAFREDSHFHAIRLLPIVRGALLEAGERLARAGVLTQPGDVWHLRFDEMAAIDDPGQVAAEHRDRLRAVVADRAGRREEYAGAPLISPASLHPRRPDHRGALVVGSPASPGTATGPVRVIRGPEEFDRLQAGEILVCPYTNPTWTPLFELAAAAVVDTGSIGSHAAITAREYGIPAVMGTGDGTRRLTDGQLVEVDGSAGQVLAASPVSR